MLNRGNTQEKQYFPFKFGKLSILYFHWEIRDKNIISILKVPKYSVVEKTLTMKFLNIFEHKMSLKKELSLTTIANIPGPWASPVH